MAEVQGGRPEEAQGGLPLTAAQPRTLSTNKPCPSPYLLAPAAPPRPSPQEFASLGRSFITMCAWLAGDPNLALAYRHSAHPLAASLLALAYIFALGLVLLNLLTGLIVNSLRKVSCSGAGAGPAAGRPPQLSCPKAREGKAGQRGRGTQSASQPSACQAVHAAWEGTAM